MMPKLSHSERAVVDTGKLRGAVYASANITEASRLVVLHFRREGA